MMKKKGLSEVVTTILIVVIAIAAVGILWAALRPTIQKGAEQAGTATACSLLQLKIDSATYNASTNITTIKIKRDTGAAELSSIKFVVDSAVKTPSGTVVPPAELETQTYTISNITTKPAKIEIAGVIGTQICSIADTETTIA